MRPVSKCLSLAVLAILFLVEAALATPPDPVSPGATAVEEQAETAQQLMAEEAQAAAGLSAPLDAATLRSEQTGTFMGVRPDDSDGDGLTNDEEKIQGTRPDNLDTDGDGLLDGWEVKGVNDIHLEALGADPLKKDAFVEMDFMERNTATRGLAPSSDVIRRIVQAFANAPVNNPDGTRGIALHLELGNKVAFDEDLDPYTTEFAALRRLNFDTKRAPVFHYMIWANAYGGGTSSGVSMDIPSSDFMVTLGRWNGGDGGTEDQKVGTFIHEFGHNLGLRHGGSDNVNFKPNHISVMNYRWQMRGVFFNGRLGNFTFQPFPLPALAEFSLDERRGLSGPPDLTSYGTEFTKANHTQKRVDAAGGPIDWNDDSDAADSRLPLDINGDGRIEILEGTPNEWANVNLRGGTIGSTSPLSGLAFAEQLYRPLPPELTEELNNVLLSEPQ